MSSTMSAVRRTQRSQLEALSRHEETRLTKGQKEIRVDESPDGSNKCVEPLDTLGHGRAELLSPLPVHLEPDSFDLLLELPRSSPGEGRTSEPDRSQESRKDEEPEPSASEGDEDPEESSGGDGEEGKSVEGEEDGREGGRGRGRKGLKRDVGRVGRRGTNLGMMDG